MAEIQCSVAAEVHCLAMVVSGRSNRLCKANEIDFLEFNTGESRTLQFDGP